MTNQEHTPQYQPGVPARGWEGRYFTDRQVAAAAIGGQLGRFLLDERAWVRSLVAWDRDCDVRVMRMLSGDDDVVRERLSLNPRLPPDLFAPMLAAVRADPDAFRHKAIANNLLVRSVCPQDVLRSVADSPVDRTELWTVLGNSNCPSDVLTRYGTDEDQLHLPVLYNRSTPTWVLVRLLRRVPPKTRSKALHNIARREWAQVRPAVALLAPQDWRELVGRLPRESLAAMSRDPDPGFRRAVADAVPDAALLRRLARDPDEQVRAAASRRLLDLVAA